jgi:apolipoprotein D and lipocalin family protein
MRKTTLLFILILSIMTGCASQKTNLKTVPFVDLDRYQGKWYEIASYPNRFQKGCHCTTAEYTKSDKGYIVVENRCHKGGVDGKESSVRGKAFVQKDSGNAKLKVQFFWPFRAHYWIIDLAPDYSYAVVSHPNMKYLWILSRTSKMDETLFNQIIDRLVEMGFDEERIQKTVHCE